MEFSDTESGELRLAACGAAEKAGEFIMSQRGSQLKVDLKKGGESYGAQVVTEVDREAQDIILRELESETERFDLAILSEELPDDGERFRKRAFWCIDPLDGTLPFIEGRSGFAVSIALVSKAGEAQLGVIHDPISKTSYSASVGGGLWKGSEPWCPIAKQDSRQSQLTVVADQSLRTHEAYSIVKDRLVQFAKKSGLEDISVLEGDGAAMNVCEVLNRSPACYFKFPKKEKGGGALWDFAASACLMREAGGVVSGFSGSPLDLNSKASLYLNQSGVIYASDETLANSILDLGELS